MQSKKKCEKVYYCKSLIVCMNKYNPYNILHIMLSNFFYCLNWMLKSMQFITNMKYFEESCFNRIKCLVPNVFLVEWGKYKRIWEDEYEILKLSNVWSCQKVCQRFFANLYCKILNKILNICFTITSIKGSSGQIPYSKSQQSRKQGILP